MSLLKSIERPRETEDPLAFINRRHDGYAINLMGVAGIKSFMLNVYIYTN